MKVKRIENEEITIAITMTKIIMKIVIIIMMTMRRKIHNRIKI